MKSKFEIKKIINIFLFTVAIIIGLSNLVLAQEMSKQKSVTGKVVDKTGASLPGVSIVLKGTTNGVNSDAMGNYSLTNISENAILQFSFVGMITQEIVVKNQTSINVILEDETIGLEEVVTVGYGTQKKVNLTGAVSTVRIEALEAVPVSNPVQALQGMVPGLNISQSGTLGGQLNNTPSINIRGTATIGDGSNGNALVLIDGMEGNLNSLNSDDIESISVLKDASASAIYGSRAPFGVILVTTKKGKSGKCQINFNSDFRSNSPIILPHMADSYQYTTAINDASFNAGQTAYFNDVRIQRIKDFMSGKIKTVGIEDPARPGYWREMYYEGNSNYDIYDKVYKKSAPSQDYSINLSGGNDNVTYYVSGSYMNQQGLLKLGSDAKNNYGPDAGKDWIKKYNLTANIDFNISKWASLSYIGKYYRQDYQRPTDMDGLNYNLASRGWPMLPLYDDNGYYWNAPNPAVDLVEGGRSKTQSDYFSQQIKLALEPIKGWHINAELNSRIDDEFTHVDHQYEYNHDIAGNPFIWTNTSYVSEAASRTNYLVPNLYTDYSKTIGDHKFKAMVGFQSELSKSRYLYADRKGIIVTDLPSIDITTGANINGIAVSPVVKGNYNEWATEGYFGRLNYDYKGRYLIEGSLRYDGTSRFGSDKRWNYFPSASAGWNISKEDFWKNLESHINYFKIRGSYGQLGNQNTTSLYPTYSSMPIGTANGTWLVGGVKTNTASAPALISSALTWERVNTWDVGADLAFFQNRLTSTFDWYKRNTENMIGPAPELPVILGISVPKTNNTDLSTTGFELAIGWKDKLSNGLSYSLNFTIADSKTRITRYPNPTNSLGTYISDQLVGQIWGYKTIGIAKTQGEMDSHLASMPNGGQDAIGSNWKAGDIMYQDLNGDGKISAGASTLNDHGDLAVIGNSSPRFPFSLDLKADWKGFDIRTFFQGILKRDINPGSDNYYFWGQVGVWNSTVFTGHLDYFRDDAQNPLGVNLNSYYPRPIFYDAKNKQPQSRYLLNAAYTRLKNLQIGYTIPSSISRKYAIQKFRIYFSGENLFTMTKMKAMFDPETVDGGWGGNIYPLSKVYSIGVNVTL